MHVGGTLTLPDGSQVGIREVGRDDRDALVAGFARLSPESRLHRFFTAMPKLPNDVIDYLTDIDQDHHVAVGVFDPARPSDVGSEEGLGVAVGRYIVDADDPTRAEMAIAVIDEYQGRGVGTLLLDALVVIARDRGIEAFTAHVLSDNEGMTAMLRNVGARPLPTTNARELTFEIDLPDAAAPLKSSTSYLVMREIARGN